LLERHLRADNRSECTHHDYVIGLRQAEISGCWRTLPGAETFLMLRSYFATARKHRMNPLAVLRQLFGVTPGCQRQRRRALDLRKLP
jgi:hypothetical protein